MDNSRRRFMKLAGLAALGLGAQPAFNAIAPAAQHGSQPEILNGPDALKAKQWAMVIDTRRLKTPESQEPLIDICNKIHNIPHMTDKRHEIKWIWETHYHNAFPLMENPYQDQEVEERPFLVLCNHCQNPPCVRACPTQATFKRGDGVVMMDFHRCIGCRFCMAACPFGSRSFNFRDPRPFIPKINQDFPTRMRGVVEKCNFCAERLAAGKIPACVEASKGAIVFGDLDDPQSEVRKMLRENYTIRRKPELGTEPCVFYII